MDGLLAPGEPHRYISTSCLHGLHERCGTMQHDRGDAGVPHCKFCPAVCACPVCDHAAQAADETRLTHTTTTARHIRRPGSGPPPIPVVS